MKPEIKLIGNMHDLLNRVCVGHEVRKLWMIEIGHGGWTIQVMPSRGLEGPPFNMRVLDAAGVERKISYWVESVEEAVRKAASTMAMAGVDVNRHELTEIARRHDKVREPV